MTFDTLLGNERLKDNLITSLRRGRASHFYVISGPQGSGKLHLARLLAAALLCTGKDRPCGLCPACRKMASGNHPDFSIIDDTEHKTVPVALIRDMRSDVYIRPNEGEKKVYLIPRAQDLGVPGQNALLKILEEPPAYGVFILLTDNPDKLLPTVRSRCLELSMQPLETETMLAQLQKLYPQQELDTLRSAIGRSGGYLGQAKALLEGQGDIPQETQALAEALCSKDSLLLVKTLAPMEKWKRDALIPVLQQWLELLEAALAERSGSPALSSLSARLAERRSPKELLRFIRHLQKAILYAQGNVSPAAVCGFLAWTLR